VAVSVTCEVVPVGELDGPTIEAMWSLFDRHYTGGSRDVFERDLRAKHQALLQRKGGELIGFTSQRFERIDGQRVTYSGDIVIARGNRDLGTARFFHRWARTMWNHCDWWCALSSGPRTFRIPHTFFRRVTPSAATDESAEEAAWRHRFAEAAYGDRYDRNTGVVRLDHPYSPRGSEIEVRASYPLDRYFRRANPGWTRGDELVSLVSLHPKNWKPVAIRMLEWGRGHG